MTIINWSRAGLFATVLWSAGGPGMALADPVTYRGTIGKLDIVVELTGEPGSAPSGRYAYMSQGIDIPLHFVRSGSGTLQLVEEEPCGRDACADDEPGPRGATWSLAWRGGADGLTGQWKGKRSLPIVLRRVGSRPPSSGEPATPLGLFETSGRLTYGDAVISPRTHPYDHQRLDVSYATQETLDWNGASFAYVVDPRTKFRYPRVTGLPGSAPTDAVNGLLTQRHWRKNIGAFACKALAYAAFHAYPGNWGADDGSMGGFEDITVEVTHLTGRALGWTESGSLWCGGASPSNFMRVFVADIRRGELVTMQEMFRDWTDSGPGEALLSFLRQRRERPTDEIGIAFEEECGMDDLMATDLGARLGRGERGETLVTFGVYGLPTVIAACADDLLTLQVEELAQHLTPQALALLR